jgi:cytochrome b subunit of formate dehydrogenase
MKLRNFINIRNKFYEKNEYLTILVYFLLLFILDYSGIMDLYGQNFCRRLINMYRRRDKLTYEKKLKPFCEPVKKILDSEDINKLQSIKIPDNNDIPWISRKHTTTHQCCDNFTENERNIIAEISEKVRIKYAAEIGKPLYYLGNNKASIYVYHGKYSQHLWHVDPQNLTEIYNVIICFKKKGQISPLQCKNENEDVNSIHFEEGDAAIFNGGTTVHQVPPNEDDNSERTVLSIAFTSDNRLNENENYSNSMCTFIKGGNNYFNIFLMIFAIFIINFILTFISGIDMLSYKFIFIFLIFVLIIVKYIPLNIDINLGSGRASSIIHNIILVLGFIILTFSIKGAILFFSYFALSDVFFMRSWVEYD